MVGTPDFLVVLTVLYLLECIRQLGPDELAIDLTTRGAYRLRQPVLYPSRRWSWILLNPFRPLGGALCLRKSPFAFTSAGVLVLGDSGGFQPYEACGKPVIEDSKVAFPNGTSIAFHSASEAHDFLRLIPKLTAAQGVKRVDRIREIAQSRFDVKAIQSRQLNLRQRTRLLRALSAGQFVVCWLLLPAAAFWVGLTMAVLVLAPAAIAISVACALAYRKLAAALYPDQPKLDYYGNIVKLIGYPVTALRCMDLLAFELVAGFDPIAVAAGRVGEAAAAPLAAKEYLDVKFRIRTTDDFSAPHRAALAEYREERLALIGKFCTQEKLALDRLLTPPAPEAGTLSYCPCCGAQYRFKEGFCADCPGVALAVHALEGKK